MSALTDRLDPDRHAWLKASGVTAIMRAFAAAGGEARIVGGCVRDALLGRTVNDIDFAVNLPPDRAQALLSEAKIKTVPTGIEYGTITAVIESKPYEITSLRQDVATFGRSAQVAFVPDWEADAKRRDFTINALYVDANGVLYDYCGGREDLAARRLRFIGNARARIEEDVLRILRFFRFYAQLELTTPDAEALAACHDAAALLPKLSAERVWNETRKLLVAANPASSWSLMRAAGVLAQFLPEADAIERLARLVEIEKKQSIKAKPLRRLAALLPLADFADDAAKRLKLSKRDADFLRKLLALQSQLNAFLSVQALRRIQYENGAETTRDALLVHAATDGSDIAEALAAVAVWTPPVFPLRGEDFLRIGLAPGPKVGILMKEIEAWWIAADFAPSRAECLARMQDLVTAQAN